MRLTNAAYDQCKTLVQLILPGMATLYFWLYLLFDIPSTEMVVGIFATFALILGLIMNVSTNRYKKSNSAYDGKIVITQVEDGPKLFSLELDGDPEDLSEKASVTFKIMPSEPSLEESL